MWRNEILTRCFKVNERVTLQDTSATYYKSCIIFSSNFEFSYLMLIQVQKHYTLFLLSYNFKFSFLHKYKFNYFYYFFFLTKPFFEKLNNSNTFWWNVTFFRPCNFFLFSYFSTSEIKSKKKSIFVFRLLIFFMVMDLWYTYTIRKRIRETWSCTRKVCFCKWHTGLRNFYKNWHFQFSQKNGPES